MPVRKALIAQMAMLGAEETAVMRDKFACRKVYQRRAELMAQLFPEERAGALLDRLQELCARSFGCASAMLACLSRSCAETWVVHSTLH